MTPQETLDHQVLVELRPPGGGPQTTEELTHSLLVLRRHGVELPPITEQAVAGSLDRLAARRQATEHHGRWEFTPVGPRQGNLF